MSPYEAERWNSKYDAFYVTRWSRSAGRPVQVGKPHACILSALAAAKRHDDRTGDFSFIDVVRPNDKR